MWDETPEHDPAPKEAGGTDKASEPAAPEKTESIPFTDDRESDLEL